VQFSHNSRPAPASHPRIHTPMIFLIANPDIRILSNSIRISANSISNRKFLRISLLDVRRDDAASLAFRVRRLALRNEGSDQRRLINSTAAQESRGRLGQSKQQIRSIHSNRNSQLLENLATDTKTTTYRNSNRNKNDHPTRLAVRVPPGGMVVLLALRNEGSEAALWPTRDLLFAAAMRPTCTFEPLTSRPSFPIEWNALAACKVAP
jgi:hypothetical protein